MHEIWILINKMSAKNQKQYSRQVSELSKIIVMQSLESVEWFNLEVPIVNCDSIFCVVL